MLTTYIIAWLTTNQLERLQSGSFLKIRDDEGIILTTRKSYRKIQLAQISIDW